MDEFLGFRRRERLKPSQPASQRARSQRHFLDTLCASKEYLVRFNQSHVVRKIRSATHQQTKPTALTTKTKPCAIIPPH